MRSRAAVTTRPQHATRGRGTRQHSTPHETLGKHVTQGRHTRVAPRLLFVRLLATSPPVGAEAKQTRPTGLIAPKTRARAAHIPRRHKLSPSPPQNSLQKASGLYTAATSPITRLYSASTTALRLRATFMPSPQHGRPLEQHDTARNEGSAQAHHKRLHSGTSKYKPGAPLPVRARKGLTTGSFSG